MWRLSLTTLSRPQRQHFRKKIPGFYSARLGASKMKFYPSIAYVRASDSIIHHPDTSDVTGNKIDWMYGTPKSQYEATGPFGANTIELKGLPMGKTPQYLQERLRRFFSKYGPVTACSALSHPLDPYQCEGTGFVSFREAKSVDSAVKATLRLGSRSMGCKTVSLRALSTDVSTDGRESINKMYKNVIECVSGIRDLYVNAPTSGVSADEISPLNTLLISADQLMGLIKPLFILADNRLFPKRLVNVDRELMLIEQKLNQEVKNSLSVPWRKDAPIRDLPKYTERRMRLWDKKDKLPGDLQILSRDFRQHKIHDEKFLLEERKRRDRIRLKRQGRNSKLVDE